MTERIALYGGTFDPFHCGHLEPIRAIRGSMGWSEVIYIPARRQPFKAADPSSSPFHRYAMSVLGTEGEPWAQVSIWELERDHISYTVDTLRYFQETRPGRAFDWIIGDDNLESLIRWRSIDEILTMANFVVLRRTGADEVPETLRGRVTGADRRPASGAIVFADNEPIVVSATEIRRMIGNGEGASDLLPPRVDRYIRQHRLYGAQEERH